MVVKKKKNPKFKPMNLGFMKSVKARWRKPRGIDNKKRIRKRSAGPVPRIGYKNAAAVRFLHPSGMKEVLVHNLAELVAAGKDVVIRIAGGVGGKKRAVLEAKATELKLKVVNSTVKAEKKVNAGAKPKAETAKKPKAEAKPKAVAPVPAPKQ